MRSERALRSGDELRVGKSRLIFWEVKEGDETTASEATISAVPAQLPPPLTRRELEIIQLINDGLTNKEIARRLAIGLATTKSHVHNLLTKLGLERRSQAAKWIRERTRATPVR